MIDKVRQEIEDWFDERVLSQNEKYRIIGLIDKEDLKDRITRNVKEFIKRLKEEFCGCEEFPKSDRKCVYCNKIDFLAGDKLI